MKSFIVNSIVQWADFQDSPFRIEVHCTVTAHMVIPGHIKARFGIGNPIMFVLTEQNPGLTFSFDTFLVGWETSFGGAHTRIALPVSSINAIVTDGFITHFQEREQMLAPETPKPPKPPVLKLVSDNPNPTETPPRGKLEVVK